MSLYTNEISNYVEKLGELTEEKDIEKIKAFDDKYVGYNDGIQKLKYLESLSEANIFQAYKAAIQSDAELYFPAGFTDEDR